MNARIWILAALGLAACVPRTQSSKVPFASALVEGGGVEGQDRPFALLRFTPSMEEAEVNGTSVARHPSGDVVLAGVFSTVADVGLGPARIEPDGRAVFVGRYAPSGKPRWVRWGHTGYEALPRVVVDGRGDVYVFAHSRSKLVPFGERDSTACSDADACRERPTLHAIAADGAVRWSKSLPDAMRPGFVATNDAGAVTIAGKLVGARRANAAGAGDFFVARYDRESGERRWFTRGRSPTDARVSGLAVDAAGEAYVGGTVDRAIEVDDVRVNAEGTESGYVVRFGAGDGVARWGTRLRVVNSHTRLHALAADPRGGLLALTQGNAGGTELVDVFAIANADGAARDLGSRTFYVPGSTLGGAADVASDGSAVLAVTHLVNGLPATDLFGIDGARSWTWRQELAGTRDAKAPSQVQTNAVAANPHGGAIVTGWFAGRAALGAAVAEAPWGKRMRRCATEDADDDDCPYAWAAHAMFVARVTK